MAFFYFTFYTALSCKKNSLEFTEFYCLLRSMSTNSLLFCIYMYVYLRVIGIMSVKSLKLYFFTMR